MAQKNWTRRQVIKEGGLALTALACSVPLVSLSKDNVATQHNTISQNKMVFKVESFDTNILTRSELTLSQWVSRLDKFISVTGYQDDMELIKNLSSQYNLNKNKIEEIQKCIDDDTIKCHRFFYIDKEFKIERILLDVINTTGTLIYWRDWDYNFQKINNEYVLWCFIGGIADMQREIKLSISQVEEYLEVGFKYIDYLVNNLKSFNYSSEYELAKKENRKVL